MSHPLLENLDERTLSVGEYLEIVNGLLSPIRVSVEGEVTDLKILPQWVFFSLKDAETGSLLRCGLHAGVYKRIGVNLEEGMAVKIFGYGKIAEKSGNFGFWVSKIEPVGEGALRRAYELLVKKLKEEGLFERKRELPQFISHIGVVSSRNGVVIQDLLQNLKPLGIRVDFMHAGVEGADSAPEILRGIEHFSKAKERPQVLVLIRGGGSLESLQGFNNEAVVRACFGAPMPVLVGIGHDVDAPIATMVADWSASTPTAVAHVINESWLPLTQDVPRLRERMITSFRSRLRTLEHDVDMTLKSMQYALRRLVEAFRHYEQVLRSAWRQIPARIEQMEAMRVQQTARMTTAFSDMVRELGRSVASYERLLSASDPQRILKRGFGLVYRPDGTLVRSVKDVKEGEKVKTRLNDGTFESTVISKEY